MDLNTPHGSVPSEPVRHRYFYGTRQRAAHGDPTCTMERELSWASNFAAAPFVLEGKRWPTTEHFYQAKKFIDTDPAWAEKIQTARTASAAAQMGRSRAHKRVAGWDDMRQDVMFRALWAKFEQNPSLLTKLRATDTDILHEDAGTKDTYWGVGTPDKQGEDLLGRLLMRVRDTVTPTDVQ